MAGLLVIAFAVGWFFVALWLARRMTRHINIGIARGSVTVLIVIVLLMLPLADEIISGFQFRALCRENAVLKIDAEKIRGRTIAVVLDPFNRDLENTLTRIYYSHHSYRDVETNEELASYNDYTVQGGLLFRSLAMGHPTPPFLPMIRNPVTSNASNSCTHYATQESLAMKYGFTFSKKPEKK